MAIPDAQLETWSHQGSVTQSCSTYNSIKDTLEASTSPYYNQDFTVFLQGSYGNDTNIYRESDVDIVIVQNSSFYHDLSNLNSQQQNTFHTSYNDATYTYFDFKRDVLAYLRLQYGDAVKPGKKAIEIVASGGRRSADIIVAAGYRRYHRFNSIYDEGYEEGICFYDSSHTRIANFPKQHSDNCTIKHQATDSRFKPTVRMFKNLRNKMIADGAIEAGSAPSYFIEGMLYNVPDEMFERDLGETFVSCINWLREADRTQLLCANEQYYLLNDYSPVTWRANQCTSFLNACVKTWNEYERATAR